MTENSKSEDAHRNDPPSADEDVAKLHLELRDYSLEQLEDIGFVKCGRESNVVRKGPYFGDKKPQVCCFAEEGVGPPPEDVWFIEREDGPPWFDVEARGDTLECQHYLAEADKYLTRYLLGRDHDAAAVAERASRLRSW